MSVNPKHKTLWNTLFASPFAAALDMPLQNCVDRLRNLEQPQRDFWLPSRREVLVQQTGDQAYRFDIRTVRRNRGSDYTVAKCSGVLYWDDGSDKTVIEGKFIGGMRMPLVVTLLLVITLLMTIFSLAQHSHYCCYSPLFVAVALWLGFQSRKDYHDLRLLVYTAFDKSEPTSR